MTPKEKAIQLVEKYFYLFSVELENTIDYRESKECALIAVDELISEYQSISDSESILVINNKLTFVVNKLVYWQEVKKEINLL